MNGSRTKILLLLLCFFAASAAVAQEKGQATRHVPLERPNIIITSNIHKFGKSRFAAILFTNTIPVVKSGNIKIVKRASTPKTAIHINTLERFEENNIGTHQRLGEGLWQGVEYPHLLKLIQNLPIVHGSPALRGLAEDVLLSQASIPRHPIIGSGIIGARLEKLYEMGEGEKLLRLLHDTKLNERSPQAAKLLAEIYLAKGQYGEACRQVVFLDSEGITRKEAYFMIRLRALCQFIAGNKAGAALDLQLLRDIGSYDRLYDEMLFMLISGVAPRENIHILLQTPLHLATFRIAQYRLPKNIPSLRSADTLAPIALSELVEIATMPFSLRLLAAERSLMDGIISPKQYLHLSGLGGFSRQDGDPHSAFAKARARLHILDMKPKKDPILQARALKGAFSYLYKQGYWQFGVQVLAPLLNEVQPATELVFFAPHALIAHIALGNEDEAGKWLRLMRAHSYAYPPLQLHSSDVLYHIRFAPKGEKGRGEKFAPVFLSAERAARMEGILQNGAVEEKRLILMEMELLAAFGTEMPIFLMELAAEKKGLIKTPLPPASLRRSFANAGTANSRGELLLLSLYMMGGQKPAGVHPHILREIIGALRFAQLPHHARNIASEAYLANMQYVLLRERENGDGAK